MGMYTSRDEEAQLAFNFCLNSYLKAARAEEAAEQVASLGEQFAQ